MAVTRAAKWFRQSVARGRARGTESDEAAFRRRELKSTRDSIVKLRSLYSGFEARDGYSLKPEKLARLPPQRLSKIKSRIRQYHVETSMPYKLVRPRSIAAYDALTRHTGAKRVKGRKAFVVHVAKPETTRVKVIIHKPTRKRKTPRATVQITRKLKGARSIDRTYFFRDYSRRKIRSMADIADAVRRMVAELPRGYYCMISSDYGVISTPMPRDRLIEQVELEWSQYDVRGHDRGLAATLLGIKRVAMIGDEADREYEQRLTMRQQMMAARQRGRERYQTYLEKKHRGRSKKR